MRKNLKQVFTAILMACVLLILVAPAWPQLKAKGKLTVMSFNVRYNRTGTLDL